MPRRYNIHMQLPWYVSQGKTQSRSLRPPGRPPVGATGTPNAKRSRLGTRPRGCPGTGAGTGACSYVAALLASVPNDFAFALVRIPASSADPRHAVGCHATGWHGQTRLSVDLRNSPVRLKDTDKRVGSVPNPWDAHGPGRVAASSAAWRWLLRGEAILALLFRDAGRMPTTRKGETPSPRKRAIPKAFGLEVGAPKREPSRLGTPATRLDRSWGPKTQELWTNPTCLSVDLRNRPVRQKDTDKRVGRCHPRRPPPSVIRPRPACLLRRRDPRRPAAPISAVGPQFLRVFIPCGRV